MKSLSDAPATEENNHPAQQADPEAQPQWGKMEIAQIPAHCHRYPWKQQSASKTG